MSTTTDLTTLKINYLTQAQYDTAKSQGLINADELYLTPAADSGINDVTVDGVSVVTDNVAEITMPTIPTKVSDLTNDVGYITDYTETDPTVPSWAKASNKPSYTASEVGAVPTSRTINGKALSSDITLSASDVSALPSSTVIPTVNNATLTIQKNGSTVKTFTANASSNVTANITVPTATSDLTNDSGFITGYTETDPVFTASAAHGITSSDISTWNGKSTISVTRRTTSGTNIADLTINGTTTKLYAPQGGGGTLTDVTVDGTSVVSGSVAEIDLTGKSDVGHTHTKSAITDFPTIPTITDTYSGTSSDGMSGKAVKSAIDALDGTVSGSAGSSKTLTAFSQTDGKVSATFGSISITKSQVSDFPTLATVATSGSYNDLSNKPTIPTVPTNLSGFTDDISTATPTASTVSKFDSSAHINSEDMSAQDVEDFVDGLNVSGGGNIIEIGDYSQALTATLQSGWVSSVPNDGGIHNVKVYAQGGVYFGFLTRYSTNYGAGLLSRYDGISAGAYLNNGTVTTKPLQN